MAASTPPKYDYGAAIEALQKLIDDVSARRGDIVRPTYWQSIGLSWRRHGSSVAALLMVYATTTTAVVSAYFAEEQRKVRAVWRLQTDQALSCCRLPIADELQSLITRVYPDMLAML